MNSEACVPRRTIVHSLSLLSDVLGLRGQISRKISRPVCFDHFGRAGEKRRADHTENVAKQPHGSIEVAR
jgi:hypothetical protein